MNLETLLADRLAAAFAAVAGSPVDPVVRVSQHADFQSGAALALARQLGRPPRDIAAGVVAHADLTGLADVELSGPGFLNLTIHDDVLAAGVDALDDRLGVPRVSAPQRIVVDYSGPNVAKDMHVGHLRPTIIGDSLVRILDWLGHDVVRVNHIGDWGTQFGMLIEHLLEVGGSGYSLTDLVEFYRAARVKFDGDEEFRTRARLRVVALQSGDELSRSLWRQLVAQSEMAFMAAYDRMGVMLKPADFVGESFYQDQLASVVDELAAKGLLVESEGALCVFPPGFIGRDGEPLPLIVRKSDGGYGYPATDLAALRYRATTLGANQIVYVVGAPQRTHFQLVFAVGRLAGWLTPGITAEHVDFGSILGPDGRMLKTRSGDTVKLADLLDEADERASSPAVGIGAIKYADLSGDRRSDYVFDWDRMLASTGNTGLYLQYAYARIRSIFARPGAGTPGPVVLGARPERRLALTLLAFEPAVTAAADLREPHRIAAYLHDLAVAFSSFYETCRVTGNPSRLTLADRTARTLRIGLDLLGIDVPDAM